MNTYFINGIRFDKLETVLSIYKRQKLSKEEVLDYFDEEKNVNYIENNYDVISPITAKQAIALENAEQRMVALRVMELEDIKDDLKAKLLDSQTITKKQIRWDKNLKPYEHSFKDTYELYRIDPTIIELRSNLSGIYFVRCKCTSTDRVYFLYVSPEVGEMNDAIAAIAWTMRINDTPLTKQQYLSLMYSES